MFHITKLALTGVDYGFTMLSAEQIDISVKDSIEILEADDQKAVLEVNRMVDFGQTTDSRISVSYLVWVEMNEPMRREDLPEAIKTHIKKLNVIFAKISLIISQLSEASPFGIIVTPPGGRESMLKVE